MTIITDNIDAFIEYKHRLGLQYETAERHMRNFEAFMIENYPGRGIPDKECLSFKCTFTERKETGADRRDNIWG